MEIVRPDPIRQPTLKELHTRKCVLLGINDPAKIAKLWEAECARRAALGKDGVSNGTQ